MKVVVATGMSGSKPRVIVGSGGLVVEVRPGIGGNISSVRTAGGLELLAGDASDRSSADFSSALGGYDDCFPAIEGEPEGSSHGWLWAIPWRVVEIGPSMVVLEARDDAHRVSAFREIRASEDRVDVRFELTNLGSAALPFVWAGHLLLAIAPGDRLLLPDGDWLPGFTGRAALPWPPQDGEWAAIPDGAYGKFFVAWPAGAQVGIERRGVVVELRSTARFLGVWVNRGYPEMNTQEHVGLEPTTCASDSRSATADVLAPGASFVAQWTLSVSPAGDPEVPR